MKRIPARGELSKIVRWPGAGRLRTILGVRTVAAKSEGLAVGEALKAAVWRVLSEVLWTPMDIDTDEETHVGDSTATGKNRLWKHIRPRRWDGPLDERCSCDMKNCYHEEVSFTTTQRPFEVVCDVECFDCWCAAEKAPGNTNDSQIRTSAERYQKSASKWRFLNNSGF